MYIFNPLHFGCVMAIALQPLQWILVLPLPPQYPEGSGWLASCFESWDTTGKNLASAILAMSWENPSALGLALV